MKYLSPYRMTIYKRMLLYIFSVNTSSLDDSEVGRKKEIEKYVQEIIKEAQEKVDMDEAGMNGAPSPEVDTTTEMAEGKETGSENNNTPATIVTDKVKCYYRKCLYIFSPGITFISGYLRKERISSYYTILLLITCVCV